MRILIVSDIHIDFKENRKWMDKISDSEFLDDILIVAGDVCHNFELLRKSLSALRLKFDGLVFVPGNHDLWLNGEPFRDSLEKWAAIQNYCRDEGIHTTLFSKNGVQIYPLLSWYTQQGEGDDSLYWPKPGEDENNRMWSDNRYVKWPEAMNGTRPSAYFAGLNEIPDITDPAESVITVSHFLPRKEVLFGEYPPKIDPEKIKKYDRNPGFNFSRVAGSALIEEQIRSLHSNIHVYGHQHINRDKIVDGVRYVSHCLGYPKERQRGMTRGLDEGLKVIWSQEK